jgi:hypothetical protein
LLLKRLEKYQVLYLCSRRLLALLFLLAGLFNSRCILKAFDPSTKIEEVRVSKLAKPAKTILWRGRVHLAPLAPTSLLYTYFTWQLRRTHHSLSTMRIHPTLFHLLCALLSLFLPNIQAWITGTVYKRHSIHKYPTSIFVSSISLESLTEHETVGSDLALSVQRWLDAEWMEQTVHIKMAAVCKETYIRCRTSGQEDLMTIMVSVADDLQSNWNEYDADAFVNAWDVSNYVSDYLTSRLGIEGCECSSKLY